MLADRITWFMRELKVPNGLAAVGYSSSDIPALVEGTLPQHRVTKLSPRPAGPEELARLFEQAMVAWYVRGVRGVRRILDMAEITLARRLTLFDATMIVMGGIVGAGIFINPCVVAQEVHDAGAHRSAHGRSAACSRWSARSSTPNWRAAGPRSAASTRTCARRSIRSWRSSTRWTLLLVSQSGGMAAVAMTFARYFRELSAVPVADGVIAVGALAALTRGQLPRRARRQQPAEHASWC